MEDKHAGTENVVTEKVVETYIVFNKNMEVSHSIHIMDNTDKKRYVVVIKISPVDITSVFNGVNIINAKLNMLIDSAFYDKRSPDSILPKAIPFTNNSINDMKDIEFLINEYFEIENSRIKQIEYNQSKDSKDADAKVEKFDKYNLNNVNIDDTASPKNVPDNSSNVENTPPPHKNASDNSSNVTKNDKEENTSPPTQNKNNYISNHADAKVLDNNFNNLGNNSIVPPPKYENTRPQNENEDNNNPNVYNNNPIYNAYDNNNPNNSLSQNRKQTERNITHLQGTTTPLFDTQDKDLSKIEIPDDTSNQTGGTVSDTKTKYQKIIEFVKFIRKVFYGNDMILKLNSLTIDNFKELFNKESNVNNSNLKSCLKGFVEFALIDIIDINILLNTPITNTETVAYKNACERINGILQNKNRLKDYHTIFKNNENNENSYYIHTLDFLEIFTEIASEDYFLKIIQKYPKMENIMTNFIMLKIDEYKYYIKNCFFNGNESVFNDWKISLDELTKNQNEKSIVTYLKLSNKNLSGGYNYKRYNIAYSLNDPIFKMLRVNYNISKENIDQAPGSEIETYHIGGLTDIFLSGDTTKQIADRLESLIQNAINGSPIFIIGYGVSGAGKTSTLIYLNQQIDGVDQNGVVMHVCNNLGGKEYLTLEMTVSEFFNKCLNTNTNTNIPDACKTRQTISFIFANGQWTIQNTTPLPHNHEYRSKEVASIGNTLGDWLVYLIDTDRLVNPTTNNPNSSRSHSVVELKLSKKSETNSRPVFLYVGDFAGVENAFACENPEVLNKFGSMYQSKQTGGKEPKLGHRETLDHRINKFTQKYGKKTNQNASTDRTKTKKTVIPSISKSPNTPPNTPPNIPPNTTSSQNENGKLNESESNFNNVNIQDTEKQLNNELNEIETERKTHSDKNNVIAIIQKRIETLNKLKQTFSQMEITADTIENYKFTKRNEIVNEISIKDGNYKYEDLIKSNTLLYNFYNKHLIKKDDDDVKNQYFAFLKDIFRYEFSFINLKKMINSLITNVCPEIKINGRTNVKFVENRYCNKIFEFNQKIEDKIKGHQLELFGKINRTWGKHATNEVTIANTWFYGHQIFYYLFTTDLLDIYLKKNLDQASKSFMPGEIRKQEIHAELERIKKNRSICNDRLEEGNYINQTLRFLRQDIRKIMNIKNKSTLYYSPNFVYDCLEDYCISQSDCFNIRSNEELSKFTCPMIDWVFNRQKDAKNTVDISDFSKKIIFGIFCVMNITPQQNEPPPIPYIDINEMKKYSNNWNVDYLIKTASESNQIIITYTNKYAMAVVIYGLERTKRLLNYYREKTKEILFSQIYENVFGKYEVVTDDTNKDKLNTILTQTNITEDDINVIQTDFKNNTKSGSYVNMIDIFNNIQNGNTDYANYGNLKTAFSNFKKLSDAIDNINASSTIGTLEFVDQFAKLNSVSVLCKTKELESVPYETKGV